MIRQPLVPATIQAALAPLGEPDDERLAEFARCAEQAVAADLQPYDRLPDDQPAGVDLVYFDGGSLFGTQLENTLIDVEYAVEQALAERPVAELAARWEEVCQREVAEKRLVLEREARERALMSARQRELAELVAPKYRHLVGDRKRSWAERDAVVEALDELAVT